MASLVSSSAGACVIESMTICAPSALGKRMSPSVSQVRVLSPVCTLMGVLAVALARSIDVVFDAVPPLPPCVLEAAAASAADLALVAILALDNALDRRSEGALAQGDILQLRSHSDRACDVRGRSSGGFTGPWRPRMAALGFGVGPGAPLVARDATGAETILAWFPRLLGDVRSGRRVCRPASRRGTSDTAGRIAGESCGRGCPGRPLGPMGPAFCTLAGAFGRMSDGGLRSRPLGRVRVGVVLCPRRAGVAPR